MQIYGGERKGVFELSFEHCFSCFWAWNGKPFIFYLLEKILFYFLETSTQRPLETPPYLSSSLVLHVNSLFFCLDFDRYANATAQLFKRCLKFGHEQCNPISFFSVKNVLEWLVYGPAFCYSTHSKKCNRMGVGLFKTIREIEYDHVNKDCSKHR